MKRHTTKTNQVQIKPSVSAKNLDTKSSKLLSLIKTNNIAWQILQYAAWLNPDNIPTTLLWYAMDNRSGFDDAIETLEKLSLITLVNTHDVTSRSEAELLDLVLNRDVQDLCFKYMSKYSNKSMKPDYIIPRLLKICDDLLPEVNVLHRDKWQEDWKRERYLPHAEALLKYVYSCGIKVNMIKLHSKLASIYALVEPLVNLRKSRERSRRALELYKEEYPGKKQSDLIRILNNLSTAYRLFRDYTQAAKYHEQAVEVYGAQLYDAAGGINKLGDDCLASRNYKGAIMAHEQALKLYEGLYGTNYPHLDIIMTLIKLSKAHCFPGNGEEALTYARQAAKICEALNGKKSSDFAVVLYNLGIVHGYCGNHNLSKECREEALKIYEELYRDGPSYIAITLNNQQLGNTHAF